MKQIFLKAFKILFDAENILLIISERHLLISLSQIIAFSLIHFIYWILIYARSNWTSEQSKKPHMFDLKTSLCSVNLPCLSSPV